MRCNIGDCEGTKIVLCVERLYSGSLASFLCYSFTGDNRVSFVAVPI